MKISFSSSAIGAAIVATSILAFASSATAATPGATFITTADIATPGSFGTTGWSNIGPGTLTDTPLEGLSGNANVRPFFGFSSPVGTSGGSTLRNVGDSSYFYVSNDTQINAQISWYADLAETSEQYLFAASGGADSFNDPAALWFSSRNVGSISTLDLATLAQFDAQFAADATLAGASVQGVGLYSNSAASVNYYSFLAGGNLFYFTPEPVFSAPTSIGQIDFGTAGRGVTATTTGFVPGEVVSAYENTTQSTSDPIDLVADANGSVTYNWVANFTNMDLGTYAIAFVGSDSGVQQFFEFDVIAQAALAATGVEATAAVVAGGVLLIGGLALAAVATRRRQRA